jgi:hypothetical protein
MWFAARYTELRRFAGKICQTVEETVKGLTCLTGALAPGISRSMTKESSRVRVEWFMPLFLRESRANHCASKYQLIRHSIRHDLVLVPFHLYRNYPSTMLPLPFKDLEWHKGKKPRHRRLSPLLLGLLVVSQLRSSA